MWRNSKSLNGISNHSHQNKTENGAITVTYQDYRFWLAQKAIAQLFGVEAPAISKHFSKIYEENELKKEEPISKMEIVQKEYACEVKRNVLFKP
jgi:hypothetical protein